MLQKILARRGEVSSSNIVQPVLLEGRELPIEGDYSICINELTYLIRETFVENSYGFKQPVYGFFLHQSHPSTLITTRLMKTKTTKDFLLLNDMNQDKERNFGYLIFNQKPAEKGVIHISDFCLEGALSNSLDHHGREYSCDELKSSVIELFADIAKKVYGKSMIKNMYSYENETPFFLANGFQLVGGHSPFLFRELT